MAFEIEAKHKLRPSKFEGHKDQPCVVLEERGVLFNGKFIELFGWKAKTGILVLYDKRAKSVGFRPAMNAQECDAAYKLVIQGKNGLLGCSKFTTKKLEKIHLDKVYQVVFDSVANVVRVDLEKPLTSLG